MELQKAVNIGKELERQLNEVDIYSFDELKNRGSIDAWLMIKKIDESACLNRLMALEGAVQNIRWHSLSKEIKEELREFYYNNK